MSLGAQLASPSKVGAGRGRWLTPVFTARTGVTPDIASRALIIAVDIKRILWGLNQNGHLTCFGKGIRHIEARFCIGMWCLDSFGISQRGTHTKSAGRLNKHGWLAHEFVVLLTINMLTTFQIFAIPPGYICRARDLHRVGAPPGRRPALPKKGSTDILAANKTPVFGRVIALRIGCVAQRRDGVSEGVALRCIRDKTRFSLIKLPDPTKVSHQSTPVAFKEKK